MSKTCALCSREIEETNEPAVLFVGKYGRRFEVCADCEALMDTLVSGKATDERNAAAKRVYHYLFEDGIPKSRELLDFFKNLFADGESVEESEEGSVENTEEVIDEDTEKDIDEDVEETPAPAQTVESCEISEEEFIADKVKPMTLTAKLLFLLLFLALGGGALAYGIMTGAVTMIVFGALIALIASGALFLG